MKLPLDPISHLKPVGLVAPAPARKGAVEDPALAKACQDFEAIFLQSLFKSMRSSMIEGGLIEKGQEQEIYQELLDMEVAKAAAAQNTLGIGRAMLRQFQEKKGFG